MSTGSARPQACGWAGVVLTGGGGTRLGGADKAALELDGAALLHHALIALAAADELVVVGPGRTTSGRVAFTREDPVGGGPAAGLLAGIDALAGSPGLVVVLAVDMPRVTASTVRRLLDASHPADGVPGHGAVLVDAGGRRQHLCAAYGTQALLAQAPDPAHRDGLAMHRLVAGLELVEVPAIEEEARDVDTWADLRALGGTSRPE